MEKKKLYFATGSRADYGIVRNYLSLLNEDEHIDLSIFVTGALLSPEFGRQVELIYKDGFQIGAEIEIPIDCSDNKSVVHSMAVALDKFGKYFVSDQPDLLIILGDRYEMFSVAVAAAMNGIPILHLHGGEATFGNYDEFIRHSITKMSLFHFTATKEFRNRVIQLGESPDRVFDLGSLGAENCLNINESKVPDEVKELKEKYFVVLFHPETLTGSSTFSQIQTLLATLDKFSMYRFVFLGSNADTHSDIVREKIKEYVAEHENCLFFENLPTSGYHYLLKRSLGLIGNSSSGLIEAPSLKIFTVNIGHRQDGRIRGNSVIDVECEGKQIYDAIQKIITNGSKVNIVNPYYKANTARNYYETTKYIFNYLEFNSDYVPKRFYDI